MTFDQVVHGVRFAGSNKQISDQIWTFLTRMRILYYEVLVPSTRILRQRLTHAARLSSQPKRVSIRPRVSGSTLALAPELVSSLLANATQMAPGGPAAAAAAAVAGPSSSAGVGADEAAAEEDGEGAGEMEGNPVISRFTDRDGQLFLLLRMLRDCSTLTIRLHALSQISVRVLFSSFLSSSRCFPLLRFHPNPTSKSFSLSRVC